MAGKFVMPKGRMTIRKTISTSGRDPMQPDTSGRVNRRVRLWDFEAKPGTTFAKLESAYLGALSTYDAVEARKVEALKSGKFTPQGATDDAKQFALNNAVPTFKRGRDAIAAAKREAAAMRAQIKLKAPDKTDIAGELLRREIRDKLLAMPTKERDAFIIHNIESMEPVVAEAILTAPAWLSGVDGSHRDLLMDKALEAQHGETIPDLHELERAIEVAASAVEAGRDEVREEIGISDPHQFDQLAAPIEQRVAAPWLRKSVEHGFDVIRVVVPGEPVAHVASAEQIASGIYFASFDEWKSANGGEAERKAA